MSVAMFLMPQKQTLVGGKKRTSFIFNSFNINCSKIRQVVFNIRSTCAKAQNGPRGQYPV